MPDLTLTAEHEQLRKATRDFAQREIVPIAAAHDESGEFPLRTVNMMGKLGLMGIEVPGGSAARAWTQCLTCWPCWRSAKLTLRTAPS